MTTYGDKQEPGIVTDLTSSAAVPTFGTSPNTLCIVGQADLANAASPADTTKAYQVTRASKAVEWFGPKDGSMLTQGVIDALNEGAYPVFAVAAESSTITQDISGESSTTVSLTEAPIREAEGSVTVTVDGTDLTTNRVHDDVADYSPDSDECFFNPVRGNVEIPTVPSDADTANDEITYEWFDYKSAIDVVEAEIADTIDFLAPLSENGSVVDYANVAVASMEEEYDLALLNAGAEIHIDKSQIDSDFEQSYDDSRTQTVYPTRFEDNTSAIAAYAGFKASLGLSSTPINRRLTTNKSLAVGLSRGQRGSLLDAQVVPLANDSRGVRIVDDPTTVSESNTDENNLQYGFNRLVADYIIETTRENQKPFIGKLNSSVVRGTLDSMVTEQLKALSESQAVISYDVNVVKDGPTSVIVEMDVDLVEPLRFIENVVTIENGG